MKPDWTETDAAGFVACNGSPAAGSLAAAREESKDPGRNWHRIYFFFSWPVVLVDFSGRGIHGHPKPASPSCEGFRTTQIIQSHVGMFMPGACGEAMREGDKIVTLAETA